MNSNWGTRSLVQQLFNRFVHPPGQVQYQVFIDIDRVTCCSRTGAPIQIQCCVAWASLGCRLYAPMCGALTRPCALRHDRTVIALWDAYKLRAMCARGSVPVEVPERRKRKSKRVSLMLSCFKADLLSFKYNFSDTFRMNEPCRNHDQTHERIMLHHYLYWQSTWVCWTAHDTSL